MEKQLIGIHHVTAITSSAQKIYDFYTNVLGMRLVKKNINQDDIHTYHLYFGDDRGSAGTAMTFFDFKGIPQHQPGTDDIARTGFRVASDAALKYWLKRFKAHQVVHSEIQTIFDRKAIYFEDFDQQQYALFSDEGIAGVAPGFPWTLGPVPDEYQILALGPIFLKVSNYQQMHQILTDVYRMRLSQTKDNVYLYEMGIGGNGATVIVEVDQTSMVASQGYGGVHHVAFRVADKNDLMTWSAELLRKQVGNTGYVERFYFGSVYARPYPNILFELATDGPGFIDDEEDYKHLGETLTLPPRLRPQRAYIEKQIEPLDTVRSHKVFAKEYYND